MSTSPEKSCAKRLHVKTSLGRFDTPRPFRTEPSALSCREGSECSCSSKIVGLCLTHFPKLFNDRFCLPVWFPWNISERVPELPLPHRPRLCTAWNCPVTPHVAPVLEGPEPSLSWVKWGSPQREETAHSAALPWEGGDEPVLVGPASAPGTRAGSKGSPMCPLCPPSPAAGDTSALGKRGAPSSWQMCTGEPVAGCLASLWP